MVGIPPNSNELRLGKMGGIPSICNYLTQIKVIKKFECILFKNCKIVKISYLFSKPFSMVALRNSYDHISQHTGTKRTIQF